MEPPREVVLGLEACRASYQQGQSIVSVHGIPAGPRGTDATLERMAHVARTCSGHPSIAWLARDIVRDIQERDHEAELRAIYEWVRSTVRYTMDPIGTEWLQVPCHTAWVQGQEDCDGHSVLVAALAIALGHGALFRVVHADARRPEEASHVYPLVGYLEPVGGVRWVAADTTHPPGFFGWEPEGIAAGTMLYRDWPVVTP